MIETYVGVAGGITRPEEVTALRQALPDFAFRRLAIGALVNEQTLHNQKVEERPQRYIDVHKMARIFKRDPFLINLIHLSLDDPRPLLPSLERLTMLGGANLHGFQINVSWPDPQALKQFRKRWLEKRRSQPWLILQIGKEAMDEVGNDSVELCNRLIDYDGCITDVMLDPSGGQGVLNEIGNLEKFIQAITFEDPGVGIGIAGGLAADNLPVVEKLLWKFPNLSIGSGRILGKEDGTIDLDRAAAFIRRVYAMQECFMD